MARKKKEKVVFDKGNALEEIVVHAGVHLKDMIVWYALCHIILLGSLILLTCVTNSLALIIVVWVLFAVCVGCSILAIHLSLNNNVYTLYEHCIECGKNNLAEIGAYADIEDIKVYQTIGDKIAKENTQTIAIRFSGKNAKTLKIYSVIGDANKVVDKINSLKNNK